MTYYGYRVDLFKDGTQQIRAWDTLAAEWIDMVLADVPEFVQQRFAVLQLAASGTSLDSRGAVRVDNVGTYYRSHKGIALWVDTSKLDIQ